MCCAAARVRVVAGHCVAMLSELADMIERGHMDPVRESVSSGGSRGKAAARRTRRPSSSGVTTASSQMSYGGASVGSGGSVGSSSVRSAFKLKKGGGPLAGPGAKRVNRGLKERARGGKDSIRDLWGYIRERSKTNLQQ